LPGSQRGRSSFPREHRLLDSAGYRRVFTARRRVSARHGAFHVRPNGLDHARLGITVSRKVSKRAVQRNRIKRQVREYFRHHRDTLKGMDLVFTAYPGCAELDNLALARLLESLWHRTEAKCAH